MIVPKNLDLSWSWSQKSASLQTSATGRSIVTKKDHVTCKGCHFTHLDDRITSLRGDNVAMILIQMSIEMHYRTGKIHYNTLIKNTKRTNKY
jgi:hypothetical protein